MRSDTIKEIRTPCVKYREFLALNSEEDVEVYLFEDEVISVQKSNKLLLKLVSLVPNLKKLSFAKLEERENSISVLVQRGEFDEIKEYFEANPNRR